MEWITTGPAENQGPVEMPPPKKQKKNSRLSWVLLII